MTASRMNRIALLDAASAASRATDRWVGGLSYWPGSQPDAYVAVSVGDTEISASSWSGHRVVLDAETGRILRSDFVK
ncbi:hypothetical protein GCM10009857_06420 [Agromyces soli]